MHPSTYDTFKREGLVADMASGGAPLACALALALALHYISGSLEGAPERAVMASWLVSAAAAAIPPAVYLFAKRKKASPAVTGQLFLAGVSASLVAIYLFRTSFYTFFPADILLWSESDFVNDILKFRIGYPIYSAQVNNESFIYPPGSQLLTYLLANFLGSPTSIPVYRVIQLVYVLAASVVALLTLRTIAGEAGRGGSGAESRTPRAVWYALALPTLFLAATNSITNPFVHTLHNDPLALLISTVAYWLLVGYATTGGRRYLWAMAAVPATGFLVKQSLIIWAPLFCFYILFFHRPLSIKRLALFAAFSFGAIAAAFAVCYLIWGDNYIYWAFVVMGNHPTSLLRSLQHMLDVWVFLAAGLGAGLVMLRGKKAARLSGLWLVWLLFTLVECYTSGIAWMLNHMGPGSLIAVTWFLAALRWLWEDRPGPDEAAAFPGAWVRAAMVVFAIALIYNGMGFVRVPVRPLPDDALRYIKEIEREFDGPSAENVLLDGGTWVYLDEGVVMKDRAVPIGDRGYGEIGDFSGILRRLQEKRYSKILVRNLDSPDFIYDNYMWRVPSGIRKALLDNYEREKTIEAVEGEFYEDVPYYYFNELSVLVPRPGPGRTNPTRTYGGLR